MLVKMRNLTLFSAALAALLLLAVFLSTCDSPLGFGSPIDLEAPVLTMSPTPKPLYVNKGAKLTGTITDNVSIDRVILRDAKTGSQIFTATLIGDNPRVKQWEIDLAFTEADNGKKLAVEVVGYDRAGNAGDQSIIAFTLEVDIHPPILQDAWIQRTDVRQTDFVSYSVLKNLEISDPRGEISANADRYQNGVFHIKGLIAENETRITNVTLNIYDSRDLNRSLLELPLDEGNFFSPVWLIDEETLLGAGDAIWSGYKNTWYDAANNTDGRYYYRVVLTANDKSGNTLRDELGYFVMWEKADIPKGVVDPLVVGAGSAIEVTVGATIPVEFFDDDCLLWSYTGLLTEEQWNGTRPIAPSNVNISGADDNAKLDFLINRFKNNQPVYNWRFARYSSETQTNNQIVNLTTSKQDDTLTIITTGNADQDNGKFVLFSLAADEKLAPHPAGRTSPDTYKTRENSRLWRVEVKDVNEPLIVFDTVDTNDPGYTQGAAGKRPIDLHPGGTILESNSSARTGNSPEENTFPKLTGGATFELNGYILRANKKGAGATMSTDNKVTTFRMAWIPHSLGDSYIERVKQALEDNSMAALETQGVQYWDLTTALITGTKQYVGDAASQYSDTLPVGTEIYTKQVFKKKFNVLGAQDDIKTFTSNGNSYKNFTVKVDGTDTRENEAKLFIFYAEDNMGHKVFRQLRLLGNKTPPSIKVYDLTGSTDRSITIAEGPQTPSTNPGLPDLNNPNSSDGNDYYFYNSSTGLIDTAGRTRYETTRKKYQPTAFDLLSTSIGTTPLVPGEEAAPNTAYPQGVIIKYWATAESNGDLAVESVKVRDITFSTAVEDVGHYDGTGGPKLSYVEKLSEVTQRVFQFVATDSLGNERVIQRTVAVTNAALLNNITTTTQTGSYGIGTTITLQANFTNLVRWTRTGNADTDANRPKLNVRYIENGVQKLQSIPTKTPSATSGNGVLALEFDFIIKENDTSVLETIFTGIGTSNGNTSAGTSATQTDRPITIPGGTRILDATRNDDAFTPGYGSGFVWTTSKGSLQASKTITLQGVRPIRNNFQLTSVPNDKTNYTDTYPGLFYRADETIEFTLTANKAIFTGSVAPVIQFQVGGAWYNAPWAKAGLSNQMIFSVVVNATNTANNGAITAIRLNDARSIVDSVGNAFVAGTAVISLSTDGQVPAVKVNNTDVGTTRVTIDKVAPTAPTATVTPAGTLTGTTFYHNTTPTLTITGNGGETAPVITQYSLDGGVSWETYGIAIPDKSNVAGGVTTILNGQHTLQARLTDRAGNIGPNTDRPMWVNAKFPDLKSITAVQTNGFYPRDGTTLQFDLAFDAAVWTQTAANVTITLTNRNTGNTHKTGGTNPSFERQLTATAVTQANAATTIRFAWTNIGNATVNGNSGGIKEMLDGLYVSAVNFTGLRDRFGNPGGASTGTPATPGGTLTITIPGYPNQTADNLNGAGLKVDSIAPSVTTYAPVNEGVLPGGNNNDRNRTIVLTFNERMIKNSGTITIRPRGSYAIPAVFENNGYYLGTNGTRYSNPSAAPTGVYTTYVDGFYDIYNKTTTAAQRTTLTQGSSMSNLTLNARTGRSAGPYIRTTHGLMEGAGYTGAYTSATGANGPNPDATARMVPDTSTKWVLDYRYLINDTTNSAVTNIRTTLTALKYRWQEIDVTSSNVSIGGAGGNVVTINLPEPALDGLEWELYYPAGTFTDEAGNNAPAIAAGNYWFWSSGVQAPVIRVNRRSFDARTANWSSTTRAYAVPGNTTNWNTDAIAITNDNGWGITDFNVVHYRIETETPGATLSSAVLRGTRANNGAVNGAWTGTVQAANTGGTSVSDANWSTTTATNGTWVLSNLIRRAGTNANRVTYTVDENGISVSRQQSAGADYQGLRSYNNDPTKGTLDGVTLATFDATNRQGRISYTPASGTIANTPSYEASKSYVIAQASITNGGTTYTKKGYEGVFRSVVMLRQGSFGGWFGTPPESNNSRMALVEGSNIKNGMPSIAGFPVRDAEETGDNRFIKVYHHSTQGNDAGNFFWVSTEIVSQWYQLSYGGTHNQTGEINNYLSAGYGDLTYSYNQR